MIRLLLLDDAGGIGRLWALLNYCVIVFGVAVFDRLLGVVSGFLFEFSSEMNSP